jgi:hypothetical protein
MNRDTITNPEKYKRGWHSGLPETECGFGSKISQTVIQREWMQRVIDDLAPASIADIGAGDLNWSTSMVLPEYQGYDLVPRHPEVREFNLLQDPVPQAEMLWCIWVINHLPEEAARIAVDKLTNSGAKWLIMTWDDRMWEFTDIPFVDEVMIRGPNGPSSKNEHHGVFMRLHEL